MIINETLATPVIGEYDAVVVGAGPAGCGAALALGRSGLKTLLIEKFNCLGGAWTTGFMNPFFDFENKNPAKFNKINMYLKKLNDEQLQIIEQLAKNLSEK